MRGFRKSLAALAMTAFSLAAHAQESVRFDASDLDPEMAAWLETMDEAVMSRWKKLTDWQNDASWINEKASVAVTGTLYNSGWLGAQVRRNVIPSRDGGWLVVDQLTIPMGLGLRVASFMTNLFFMEQFPFVQAGAVKERTFVDVRERKEYRDALLAAPFNLRKLPLNGARLERMEIGETISTVDDGGFEVQGAVGLSTLMGMDLVPDRAVDLGLSGRMYFRKSRRIDITRDGESTALVLMQDSREKGASASAGISISLEMVPGPALFGVNAANAFVPVKVNALRGKGRSTAELYRFELAQAGARDAFGDFVRRDFTRTSAALQAGAEGVTRELLKEGDFSRKENNGGVNLIFFRAGKRSIVTQADFVSTLADGKSYAVGTRSLEKVSETGSYRGAESTSRRYELIMPLNPEARGAFVLDYAYRFADRSTSGKELAALLTELEGLLAPRVVFPRVDPERSYGDIRAELTLRFTREAVSELFSSARGDGDLWEAIAATMGVTDPTQWSDGEGRASWARKQGREGERVVELASKLRAEFERIKAEPDPTRKMTAIERCDRKLEVRNLCLKTMIRLSKGRGMVIRGAIHGEKLGFGGVE